MWLYNKEIYWNKESKDSIPRNYWNKTKIILLHNRKIKNKKIKDDLPQRIIYGYNYWNIILQTNMIYRREADDCRWR